MDGSGHLHRLEFRKRQNVLQHRSILDFIPIQVFDYKNFLSCRDQLGIKIIRSCCYVCSHFFGNLILYWLFNDTDRGVDRPLRVKTVLTMSGFIVIALLMMFGIQPPLRNKEYSKIVRSPVDEVLKSAKLLSTPKILLLVTTMTHIGEKQTNNGIISK